MTQLTLDVFIRKTISMYKVVEDAVKIIRGQLMLCPHCGSSNVVKVGKSTKARKIPKGIMREGSIKALLTLEEWSMHRYLCKDCGRRFTPRSISNLPLFVVALILLRVARGFTSRDISADLRETLGLNVSHTTVINITKRSAQLLKQLERTLFSISEFPPEVFSRLYIDDTWRKASREGRRKLRKRPFWFLIVIIDATTGYCLTIIASDRRDEKAFKKAIQDALALLQDRHPSIIRSDDYKAQVKALRKALKTTRIEAKSKKEDFGWINKIEAFMRSLRKPLDKLTTYRSLEHLQSRAIIVRFYCNFIKVSRQGKTPAQLAGVQIPISDSKISHLVESGSSLEKFCFFLNLALAIVHAEKALKARLRCSHQNNNPI